MHKQTREVIEQAYAEAQECREVYEEWRQTCFSTLSDMIEDGNRRAPSKEEHQALEDVIGRMEAHAKRADEALDPIRQHLHAMGEKSPDAMGIPGESMAEAVVELSRRCAMMTRRLLSRDAKHVGSQLGNWGSGYPLDCLHLRPDLNKERARLELRLSVAILLAAQDEPRLWWVKDGEIFLGEALGELKSTDRKLMLFFIEQVDWGMTGKEVQIANWGSMIGGRRKFHVAMTHLRASVRDLGLPALADELESNGGEYLLPEKAAVTLAEV